MAKETISNKITIYGSPKEIAKAKKALTRIHGLEDLKEPEARLKIQHAIDKHKLEASILYKGNTVWNREKIIRNLKRIIKAGTLYNAKKPSYIPIGSMLRMPAIGETILSKYFYTFLHLVTSPKILKIYKILLRLMDFKVVHHEVSGFLA